MANKMAIGPSVRDFVQRFHDLQAHRDSADTLIKDLVLYCNEIENQLCHESQRLVNCQLDLADATNTRRELQQRIQLYDSTFERVTKENEALKNRNPYVMVLIDGDGLIFREQWIRQGLEGGKKAAYALRSAIAEQFGNPDDLEIVAKVVANLAGLAKAMQRDGSLDSQGDLKDFTLGFTQAKATFDFVDVGYGKERADSKIKETTRWHLRNHNCKHILLGISHDAGYAPFLDEILQDESTRQRIGIVEGVPTVGELVSTNVNVLKLGTDIFRNDKLVDKSHSTSYLTPATNNGNTAGSHTTTTTTTTTSPPASVSSGQNSTPTLSYAGIVSSASPPPQMTLPFALKPLPSAVARQKQQASQYQMIPPSVPEDWHPGHRGLDEPIRVNTQVLETIKKRKDTDKLCNNHYLRGPCAKRDVCQFVHDYKVSEDEIKAIAVLARQNPCTAGQYCEADDCIYGHHCPSVRDGICIHPFCKFSEDAHPPGTKFKNSYIRSN